MTPRKLNVFFSFFPYGGNGGISSEHPSIRDWYTHTILKAKADERIGELKYSDFSDTPITMTRNLAVRTAKQAKADVLVMCDSDQYPDCEISEPGSKPFWDSSFDFIYESYDKGPHVVGAPYCGPPPRECVYVFKWTDHETDNPSDEMGLEMFSREEAAIRGGIEPVAALPTGLIMYDLRAFELISPPFFYYEYTDAFQSEKASTEDVTNTRDIALCGQQMLGYNPIHCNWDAWAGHMKPKLVRKPKKITTDHINKRYKEAVVRDQPHNERLTYVRMSPATKRIMASHNGNGKKKG